ncbi:hypothetical protein ACN27J_20425 [Solwaraspora sp. WMMB762]|uniref:hypothetical protein n=1 Tax=Solwaraspora sp. WMMB762 TaxID=3404120 RepID=UPI003B93F4AD
MREIHVEIDEAIAEAYGWSDLRLNHGFHETRQGARYTIDPAVQVEILDTPRRSTKSVPRPRGPQEPEPLLPAFHDAVFPRPDALF